MKILFDTDPGIDDAMALLLLARDPRSELVGVTTVFGNASIETTTRNALALCERFGIDVPVAAGAGRPLVKELHGYPDMIHGLDGLGNVAPPAAQRRRAESASAERVIVDCARRHEGELTLVAVGPLTNLALALQLDPDLPRRVARVVVMGGAFGVGGQGGNITPVAEANIYGDPHAADAVFAAPWPVTLVGLDVTHRVHMSTDYLRALGEQGGDDGRYLWDVTRFYEAFYVSRTGGGIYSHDPSAVVCALDPAAFTLRAGPVRVATEGIAAGQTIQVPRGAQFPVPHWDALPEQQVCVAVDSARVLGQFRDAFVAPAGQG